MYKYNIYLKNVSGTVVISFIVFLKYLGCEQCYFSIINIQLFLFLFWILYFVFIVILVKVCHFSFCFLYMSI